MSWSQKTKPNQLKNQTKINKKLMKWNYILLYPSKLKISLLEVHRKDKVLHRGRPSNLAELSNITKHTLLNESETSWCVTI